MDPSTHADASAAQTAITSTGATISKTYSFSLTYKIEAEDAQRDAINGVLHIEDYGREAVITPTFNTNHLKMLCNDVGSSATAYNPSSTGSGEHIYLVDTGVNTTHAEFSGRTVNNLYTGFGSGTDFTDTDGHGTSMASLIIGANIGTAKDCLLYTSDAADE